MAVSVRTAAPPPGGSNLRNNAIDVLAKSWVYLFLIAMIVYFSFTAPGFFSIRNLSNVLVTSTLVGLMAIGQTYVIITSGIDLSIGYTVGLASVISATLMRNSAEAGTAIPLAILIGIVAGLAVSIIPGIINGILIARVKVPPFIATLGMYGIIRGAAYLLTDGQQVVGNLPRELRDVLSDIGNGSLLYNVPNLGLRLFSLPDDLPPTSLRFVDQLIPYPFIITAIIVVVFAFILGRTKFGRHTYAIGGSKDAAIRAGINLNRHLILIYVLCAFTAGIAGVLYTFRFTAGSPEAGDAALLSSVAAVVIGGTSLFGGEGRIGGSVVGALIIAVLQTGLVMRNIDPLWQFVVVGVVIIIAVVVNQSQAFLERQKTRA